MDIFKVVGTLFAINNKRQTELRSFWLEGEREAAKLVARSPTAYRPRPKVAQVAQRPVALRLLLLDPLQPVCFDCR